MAYSNLPIGTTNPGLAMILVDQSYSMRDPFDNSQKKDFAALAVNRAIYEIVLACQSGEMIKDRVFLAVIGYGEDIQVLLEGQVSQIADNPIEVQKMKKKEPDGAGGLVELDFEMPIWIKAKANNGTPMGEAFEAAYQVAEEWVKLHPDNFPPIVINITDGEPNKPDHTRDAALQLMDVKTNDGNLLLMNAHISNASAGEVALPEKDSGLYDEYARFLFNISSVLPEPLIVAAQSAGFSPQTDARGFLFNAGAEKIVKLLEFGTLKTLGLR
jgi:hypothetical protein